ncbi:hypothetical protein FDUTEX481_08906 [Tolypothrix sp. PCC 7601]|nr:hypothetical protein FDUTEX481_08906 [Tolypothrix sp. PCC 7601]
MTVDWGWGLRCDIRDFQEINYPFCGVGILPALILGRARCPSHKRFWDVFLFGSPLCLADRLSNVVASGA